MSEPQRTCIACRHTDAQSNLLRLVQHPLEPQLVPDIRGKLPGRGAWVHYHSACIQRLEQNPRIVAKAFRCEVTVNGLYEQVLAILLVGILDGLSLSAASGRLVGGHDQIVEALNSNHLVALVYSSNVSKRTFTQLEEARDPSVETFVLPLSSSDMGYRVGKGPRAAVGIFRAEANGWLMMQLRRRQNIG